MGGMHTALRPFASASWQEKSPHCQLILPGDVDRRAPPASSVIHPDRSTMSSPVGEAPPWRTVAARVLVVLPAYNEEQGLGVLLRRLDQSMDEDGFPYQIIVVDDGSRDATARIAADHARYMPIRLERHAVNQGLGATIRDGLRVAVSLARDEDVIVVMDADNTHTPGLIRNMFRVVREGADVVIASRYRPGSRIRGVPPHRRLLSFGARVVFQLVFPTPGIRDYTCAYRAYRASVLTEAFRRYGDDFVNQDGFQCMVDILLKLRRMDLIFREVPLILRYDLKEGASKMNVAGTIGRTLRLVAERRFGRS
jgi:dolichol-phosphate mannosyltransferase